MYNSRFVTIYNSLNKEEKRQFKKFYSSGFVIKYREVLGIFKYIETRKNVTKLSLDKNRVFEYIFPNNEYNDTYMRQLIFQASKVIESFIVFKQAYENDILKDVLLSEYYVKKELLKDAQNKITDTIDNVKENTVKNANHYFDLFRLNRILYDIQAKDNRSGDFNINEVIVNLNTFVIIEVLKYSTRLMSIKEITATKAKNILLKHILKLIEEDDTLIEIPQIRIYYNIYKIHTDGVESMYQDFLEDVKKHEQLFDEHDLNELYRLAINFCIRMVNSNNERYYAILYDLYIYTIEQKLLLENDEISRFTFTNIITVLIKLKRYTDAEDFIIKYEYLLNKEYKENTIDFNRAKILYELEDYSAALDILNTSVLKDVLWNLNAKNLQLKILYEMNELDWYQSQLNAFIAYVNRQKDIGYHKEYFTKIYKAHKKLTQLRGDKVKEKFTEETPQFDWFNKVIDSK